jgi:Uma2 family endonuclease
MGMESAMSIPEPKRPGYTLEDWASWEGRWELINGVAYDMTPSPSTQHQRLVVRLLRSIGDALQGWKGKRGGRDGEVFPAPLDVFLDAGVFQPDLVVVCDPRKIAPKGIVGVPDLVVEILSPGTASKDLTRKRWAYELAGVPEYLVVDPDERYGLLLRLEGGRYEEFRLEWDGVMELMGGHVPVTLA